MFCCSPSTSPASCEQTEQCKHLPNFQFMQVAQRGTMRKCLALGNVSNIAAGVFFFIEVPIKKKVTNYRLTYFANYQTGFIPPITGCFEKINKTSYCQRSKTLKRVLPHLLCNYSNYSLWGHCLCLFVLTQKQMKNYECEWRHSFFLPVLLFNEAT